MDRITVNFHSTELVGTCDKTGECPTLAEELGTLEDMGIDQDAIDILVEHRQGVCSNLGKCSLYFGTQEKPRVEAST